MCSFFIINKHRTANRKEAALEKNQKAQFAKIYLRAIMCDIDNRKYESEEEKEILFQSTIDDITRSLRDIDRYSEDQVSDFSCWLADKEHECKTINLEEVAYLAVIYYIAGFRREYRIAEQIKDKQKGRESDMVEFFDIVLRDVELIQSLE